MLLISLLKARIGAQMEGGGGTRVTGMTSSTGSIWSISVWMTQVANVSCSSDGKKRNKRNEEEKYSGRRRETRRDVVQIFSGFSTNVLRATSLSQSRYELSRVVSSAGPWDLVCLLGLWKEPSVLSTGLYPYCILTSRIMYELPAGSLFLLLFASLLWFTIWLCWQEHHWGVPNLRNPIGKQRDSNLCFVLSKMRLSCSVVRKSLSGPWKPLC